MRQRYFSRIFAKLCDAYQPEIKAWWLVKKSAMGVMGLMLNCALGSKREIIIADKRTLHFLFYITFTNIHYIFWRWLIFDVVCVRYQYLKRGILFQNSIFEISVQFYYCWLSIRCPNVNPLLRHRLVYYKIKTYASTAEIYSNRFESITNRKFGLVTTCRWIIDIYVLLLLTYGCSSYFIMTSE